jgi:hypothetical protein
MTRPTVAQLDEARESREALALVRLGMELGARQEKIRALLAQLAAEQPARPRHLRSVQ